MGVFKRGEIWYIRKKIDGRKYVKSSNSKIKRDAEQYLQEVNAAIRRGTFSIDNDYLGPLQPGPDAAAGKRYMLSDGVAWYVREKINKRNTDERNKHNTEQMIREFFTITGDMNIYDMKKRHLTDYKSALEARGNSGASIDRKLGAVSGMFSAVADEELIDYNPLAKKFRYTGEVNRRDRVIKPHEIKAVHEAIKEPQFYLIFSIALMQGIRLKDVVNMTLDQIDRDYWTFNFIQSKTSGKIRRKLILPIAPILQERVRQYIEARGITGGRLFDVSASWVSVRWAHLVEVLGFGDLQFLDLRRTFAMILRNGGADAYMVDQLLGHRTKGMISQCFDHYVKNSHERMRDAIERSMREVMK